MIKPEEVLVAMEPLHDSANRSKSRQVGVLPDHWVMLSIMVPPTSREDPVTTTIEKVINIVCFV
jgi:hypothetical protein